MAFKIVVGYDGSDGAKAALDKAVDLAGRLSSEVLLTCAYGGPEAYSAEPLTLRHTLQEAGETLISDAMARSANSGVSIEPLLVDLDRESAAQGLLSVARQRRAEMIVVGAHGQSPIAAMLLGSTTYKLLHITSKPLLVVPAAQGSPTSELPSKIVVGYDGSDGAKAALDAAVGLAGRLSGKVLVIHGYGGPGSSGVPLALKQLGEELLTDALARSGGRSVAVEPVLVDASAAQSVLGVARRRRAEMIVMGAHGQSLIRAMLLGSTTYKLLHITTKPLLVVPAVKRQKRS